MMYFLKAHSNAVILSKPDVYYKLLNVHQPVQNSLLDGENPTDKTGWGDHSWIASPPGPPVILSNILPVWKSDNGLLALCTAQGWRGAIIHRAWELTSTGQRFYFWSGHGWVPTRSKLFIPVYLCH